VGGETSRSDQPRVVRELAALKIFKNLAVISTCDPARPASMTTGRACLCFMLGHLLPHTSHPQHRPTGLRQERPQNNSQKIFVGDSRLMRSQKATLPRYIHHRPSG
jgi:hypothetical protein